jgi:L-alanine-DL-glutamate epimerase-like enolase superfamily enzyme
MKIVRVDVEMVDLPAVTPAFRWREGLPGSEPARTGAWLRLTTDDGVVGRAWCVRGVILADLVDRRLRQELLGADPFARETLWHRIWEMDRIEELPVYVPGVVDVALWDLVSTALGIPAHALAGTARTGIEAYASTVTFDTVEEFCDVATQCLELGYKAIKLHAWGDARRDAALVTALREHVGDDVPLMYDGSAGFDLADALHVGRACADADYLWYEEPMREASITSYEWLAERCDVPLLVAETSDGAHWNTADWIRSGCATYVRTSAMFKGGFTGALRVAHLAESFGLRAEVHGSGPESVHLAMAVPNTTYYESLVTSNPVVREPLVGADGVVRPADVPGIGWDAYL